METVVDEVLDSIRARGGRATPVRRAVLQAVFNGDTHHFTAADIAEAVKRAKPRPDRATIYRTLELLCELGLLTPLQLDGDSTVYHRTDQRHGHLVCTNCGRVIELPSRLLATMARTVDSQLRFRIKGDRVAIPGLCERCRDDHS